MSSERRPGRALVWLKYRFLGDAVFTTPLLEALAATFERPSVLVAPHVRELLSGEPGLDLLPNVRGGLRDSIRLVKSLRKARFDTCVLVNRSFRSAALARLAGIRTRIGFDTEGRGWLLTHPVKYDDNGFEGGCYARLAEPLALQVAPSPPKLTLLPGEAERGSELRQTALVGLQPGASAHFEADLRAMPCEHSAKIANALSGAGFRIALFGAAAERSFTEAVLPLLNSEPVDLVGKCSLRETMGAMAGLRCFVGADSGLIHIGVALGVPTVTTFSKTPAAKWGHNYPPHRVFSAPNEDMRAMDVDGVIDAALEQVR